MTTKRTCGALTVAVLAVVLTFGCGAPTPPAPTQTALPPAASSAGVPSAPSTSAVATPSSSPVETPTAPGSTASTSASTSTASPTAPPPTTTTTQAPTRSCADLVSSLTLRQRVGQLFMVGVSSSGMTGRDAEILGDGDVGSVIFLQNSRAGAATIRRLVTDVRGATKTPHGIDTMITVDQEGGKVQRLRGRGFDRIPSARVQERLSDRELTDEAETWGRQLKQVGVDADLAPVADVVPTRLEQVNEPIGLLRRGYGPDPQSVARKVTAFVAGMQRAGMATSVKHFPGLGQVRGNTDFERHVVDYTTSRHDRDLQGFVAGAAAGVDMVMVSTAFYDTIDQAHQAAFSPIVIDKMIRGDLHFNGVVISDDLAGRGVSDVTSAVRAVTFLKAGGDLAIVGNASLATAMIARVVAEARSDPDFAAEVSAKATRVLAMKDRRGLAHCS